ncbi:helicase C-terminal domain-containing protein [Halteromyces radiatus]|uniref:helicase C-terminal domain-containing protein n=1 Tax=Halteromyces radiatus TaxID=101107 RepID=UPI00221EB1D8|nr:helicase C-terminal domain-containing protein [Halteromyces radiatus]KAI8097764.1 helicase C-terminal domain-containing protein [Halteromyces radiatus]
MHKCLYTDMISFFYIYRKDTQVSLKRSYNDNKKRRYPSRRIISGDDWYTIQGYRAINQALGRCIRHKKDWGAIILLEERFNEKKNIEGLSKWIRKLCKIHDQGFDKAIKDLQTFVQGRMDIEFGYNVDIDQ